MQAVEIRTYWPSQLCQLFASGRFCMWPNASRTCERRRARKQMLSFQQRAVQLLDRRRGSMLSLGRSKVLAALGLILTLAIASVALLTQMRPARASSSSIAPWSDSLAEYGMPTSPTSWQPSNWDVQIHTRDRY